MIEKLKTNEDKIFRTESGEMMVVPALNVPQCISDKINELIDAVNELQINVSKMENLEHLKKIGQGFKKLNDPYAEQRKWIGKLCRFWNRNENRCGILTAVFNNNKYGKDDSTEEYPFQRDSVGCWQHCEPVSPDDDIIYKKGTTMTELKCPFCGEKLVRYWGMEKPAFYCCDNPKCSKGGIGTEQSWQALIDTKKKLDVAVDALFDIHKHSYACCNPASEIGYIHAVCYDALDKTGNALEQITALEQKDK